MEQHRRGVLYPARLPEFHRVPPPAHLEHAVRWFWIPEWSLPDGVESHQHILPFPACNLVVEPEGISAVGPATRSAERVLRGRGWAVGALLLPAAVPALAPEPAAIRDSERSVDDPELLSRVTRAMADRRPGSAEHRDRAVALLSEWIAERAPASEPGSEGALANALGAALDDPGVTRVDELPARLHASVRTLQRLADRCFGLSLHSMIRRRRLQEAAERLREHPGLTIAALAIELGYADHAHFTTDFKRLLGVTPREYRARARS